MDYLVGRSLTPIETVIQSCISESGLAAEQEKLLMDLTRSMILVIKNNV